MADAVSRELACQTALAKTPVKPTAPPTTSDLERKWRDANTLSGAYGVGILPTHAELACPVAAKTPSVTAASPTVRDHDARLCAVSALSLDTKLAHMRDVLAEHGLSDRAFCREADLPYVSPGVGYSGRTKRDMLNDARRAVGLRELVSALPIAHTARGDNGYNAELASAAAVGIPAPDFDIAVTTATPIVTAPMTAPAATSTVVAPAGCTVVTPSTTSTVIAPADATVFAPAAAAVRPTPNRWSTCALVTATSAVNVALLLVAVMFAAPAYEPGESTASSTRPLPVTGETCLVALAVAFVALCASIAMSASAKLAYRLACLCLQANTGSGGSRDRATSLGGLPPWTFSSLAARRRSDAASRVSSCLQPTALPRLPWCLAAYFVAVYLDVGLAILRCQDDDATSTTFAGSSDFASPSFSWFVHRPSLHDAVADWFTPTFRIRDTPLAALVPGLRPFSAAVAVALRRAHSSSRVGHASLRKPRPLPLLDPSTEKEAERGVPGRNAASAAESATPRTSPARRHCPFSNLWTLHASAVSSHSINAVCTAVNGHGDYPYSPPPSHSSSTVDAHGMYTPTEPTSSTFAHVPTP